MLLQWSITDFNTWQSARRSSFTVCQVNKSWFVFTMQWHYIWICLMHVCVCVCLCRLRRLSRNLMSGVSCLLSPCWLWRYPSTSRCWSSWERDPMGRSCWPCTEKEVGWGGLVSFEELQLSIHTWIPTLALTKLKQSKSCEKYKSV